MGKTHVDIDLGDRLQRHTKRKLGGFDFTLDDAHLQTRCPLDNSRNHSGQWRHSVGQLGMLPLEIISDILLALDLPTLTAFRRVNRRAMGLVDSLHQYNMVLKHCPDILRAILSIEASSFDCATLYEVLRSQKCETCDRFGAYLYLITCKRVCYFCFNKDMRYLPVTTAGMCAAFPKELHHIPRVLSLPGRYTAAARPSPKRVLLCDRQALLDSQPCFPLRREPSPRYTGQLFRYMVIISAPYFDLSGQSADWGYYCTNCKERRDPRSHFRNKFTKEGILDHFRRECPAVE